MDVAGRCEYLDAKIGMYRVQVTASLLLCFFTLLIVFAMWLAFCPSCVLTMPFPAELAPGKEVPRGNQWIRYDYEYAVYGSYFVGEWSKWRVYAGAVNRTINYTGYVCRKTDCGLYLGDVVALYGKPEDVHHSWTICVYDYRSLWVTATSDVKKGRFGCNDLRRPVRSISFRE